MSAPTTAGTGASPGPLGRRRALLFAALVSLLALALSGCLLLQIREQYGVEVVTEGQTWDEAGVSRLHDALQRLPPHVVRRLGSPFYGRLQVLSNPGGVSLEGWQPYANGANFYSNYGERNQLVLVPDQSVLTVLHELGHAYQMREVPSDRYAWVLFQTEMREYLAATGWELLSSDAEVAQAHSVRELRFSYSGAQVWETLSNADPVEDYANAFALYFYDPDELQGRSPERHAFMRDHVARDTR